MGKFSPRKKFFSLRPSPQRGAEEEEDREDFGYYDCLEQTVSDEFVNLDLPVFVDGSGNICVYVKISSMAGSGIICTPDCIFESHGVYEEAVG